MRNDQEAHSRLVSPPTLDHGEPRPFRPVTIDADGRIFLESGEQLIIPGLEPEKIRQMLADEAAGNVYRIVAGTRDEFLAKLDALCEDEGELPD